MAAASAAVSVGVDLCPKPCAVLKPL